MPHGLSSGLDFASVNSGPIWILNLTKSSPVQHHLHMRQTYPALQYLQITSSYQRMNNDLHPGLLIIKVIEPIALEAFI
jgi:hypothetical protein